MFIQLLLSQLLIFLSNLPHFNLQLIDDILVLGRIAHLFGTIQQLLNMLVLVLQHFLLSFDLTLQLIDLIFFLFDDTLQIQHPLQRYLIRLFALVIPHCLLQPLNHLVCIFQLHILRFQRNRMTIFNIVHLQLVLCCFLQLLIQTHRQLFQFPSQLSVLVVQTRLILNNRLQLRTWRRGLMYILNGCLLNTRRFEGSPLDLWTLLPLIFLLSARGARKTAAIGHLAD